MKKRFSTLLLTSSNSNPTKFENATFKQATAFSATKYLGFLTIPLILSACGGGGGSEGESADTQTLSQDTAFLFVERSISSSSSKSLALYQESLLDLDATPLDLNSPYAFNPGAKLIHRSSLDVDAEQWTVLADYFGSTRYDVKDLNVSQDGSKVLFAARGPEDHLTDYTWNVYEYEFESKNLRRIISDSTEANSAHDTTPSYANDGRIVFSSDRAAGNPNWEEQLTETELDEDCYKVGPAERPSLLHIMSADGDNIMQLTFGNNHDTKTTALTDGRIAFIRWSRSYELIPQCDDLSLYGAGEVALDHNALFPSSNANGLQSPEPWTYDRLCGYTVSTFYGQALPSNNYTLLTVDTDTEQLEQLYETVTLFGSDEEFVSLDKIVQGSDGYLIGLMKHFYNQQHGGNVVTLQSPTNATNTVFGNVAPRSLVSDEVDLYPNQLSLDGWFSAVTPYRDGTDRLLVSWSQCATVSNGVNSFCDQGEQGDVNSQYGIWVYEPRTDSRLPIVRAKSDVVYTELAIAEGYQGADLPFSPINSNYEDNTDESRIICDDPSYIPPSDPNDPNDPQDPNDPNDPNDPSDPNDPTDPSDPNDPTDPTDPVDPGDPGTNNQSPTANAGADQNTDVQSIVILDGSASNDPDGQPQALTFTWHFVSLPIDSQLDDSDILAANSVSPSFSPDVAGNFELSLQVSDGEDSATDVVGITADNQAPVVEAGIGQNVVAAQPAILDGSESYDPDNDTLTYLWSLLEVPPDSVLTNNDIVGRTTPNPSFIPDAGLELPIKADFVFIVDGSFSMDEEIAEVRQGLSAFVQALSDPENQIDARFAVVTFEERPLNSTIPVVKLAFTVSTTVQDVTNDVITAFDNIDTSYLGTVQREAGLEAIRYALADPSLAGSPLAGLEFRSDARINLILATDEDSDGPHNGGDFEPLDDITDGSPEAQVWQDEIDATAALVIANNAFVDLLIEPSDTPTTDQYGDPSADRTEANSNDFDPQATLAALEDPVTGHPNSLQAQVLRAGLIARSYPVTQATNSTFVDSFFTSKVEETIDNPLLGNYVFSLVVNDGDLNSDVDTVTVRAFSNSTPPNALAGSDQTSLVSSTINLDGSASNDADNAPMPLSYQWQFVSVPTGSSLTSNDIINADSALASFTPDVIGEYEVELEVEDGAIGNNDTDTIIISVLNNDTPPSANAGANQNQAACNAISLDGSDSIDPDNIPNALNYRWSFVSLPANSSLLSSDIQNSNSMSSSFTPDRYGSYVVELQVDDGQFNGFDNILVDVGIDPNLDGTLCTP